MAGKHPKFAQEMFERANISITLGAYSHVFDVYCCRVAATGDYG
jgi:hypothetical protein